MSAYANILTNKAIDSFTLRSKVRLENQSGYQLLKNYPPSLEREDPLPPHCN